MNHVSWVMCALLWFSFFWGNFLIWSQTIIWNFLPFWSVKKIYDGHGEKEGWPNYQYAKVKINRIRKSAVWRKQKEGMILLHWYWGVGINDFTFIDGMERMSIILWDSMMRKWAMVPFCLWWETETRRTHPGTSKDWICPGKKADSGQNWRMKKSDWLQVKKPEGEVTRLKVKKFESEVTRLKVKKLEGEVTWSRSNIRA